MNEEIEILEKIKQNPIIYLGQKSLVLLPLLAVIM